MSVSLICVARLTPSVGDGVHAVQIDCVLAYISTLLPGCFFCLIKEESLHAGSAVEGYGEVLRS